MIVDNAANPNLLHDLADRAPSLYARLGELVVGDRMSDTQRRAVLPMLIELFVNAVTIGDVASRLELMDRVLAGPGYCDTVQ